MEAFAACVLTHNEFADGFDPELAERLEQVLIVDEQFKYKYLEVEMALMVVLEQQLHKLWHTVRILCPGIRKQALHPVKQSLDVLHTLMFVYLVDLQAGLCHLRSFGQDLVQLGFENHR